MNYSEGNRDNPYSFDDYLFVKDNYNYYTDDQFLQNLIKKYVGDEFDTIHKELTALSKYISFRWRELANSSNELENHLKVTKVKHYDAHNHRIDRIERCAETKILENEIFSLGLFDPDRNSPWSRFCIMFLLYQNGEAGVMCPVACTHGLIWLMQKYEEHLSEKVKSILERVRKGKNGIYEIGAQFVSEIQGGSDVPAN